MKEGLGCLLVFISILLVPLITIAVSAVRFLLPFRKVYKEFRQAQSRSVQSEEVTENQQSKRQEKIFKKDEGEYVDFEEIK